MAAPEEVGFSAERLQRIRPVLQHYIDTENLPGFLTAIARRGKIVHFETIGMRDLGKRKTHGTGYHLPYLLHVEADYQRRRDDAL